ncbi:MAG: FAD:protein FMN transferase [Candidatus Dormibacteraeota bacterium]|nr:FAD:protein FMN transferase [Candidatus Dormibacteraeota bacterium]
MVLSSSALRTVRVEHIMGTAISVDVRDAGVREAAFERCFDMLRAVDTEFSTYREDSAVSRLRRGDLEVDDTSADFREVLELCEEVRRVSDGAFDAWSCSPGGLDPSGLVKGWSIDRGAQVLETFGLRNFCINAGGDVLARGVASPGAPWRVGIRHPGPEKTVVAVVAASGLAVATSGEYERGAHIRGAGGARPSGLLSMTVVGPDLTFADAYATAAFAMGEAGIDWVNRLTGGYEGFAVTAAGRGISTQGFERLRLHTAAPAVEGEDG